MDTSIQNRQWEAECLMRDIRNFTSDVLYGMAHHDIEPDTLSDIEHLVARNVTALSTARRAYDARMNPNDYNRLRENAVRMLERSRAEWAYISHR